MTHLQAACFLLVLLLERNQKRGKEEETHGGS